MKGRGHIARTGGKLHHTDRQIGSHRSYTEHFHHLQYSTLCGNTAHWSRWKGIHTVATTCYCLATCTVTPDDVDNTEASLKTGRTLEKQLIEHEPQWWEMTRRMGLGLGLGLGLGIIFNVGKPLARRLLIQAPPSHHWFCPQQVERHGSAPCFTSTWPTTWPTNIRRTTPLWWPGWDAESHLHYWDPPSGLCGDSKALPLLWLQWMSHWCPERASSTDQFDSLSQSLTYILYYKSNFTYYTAWRFSFTCLCISCYISTAWTVEALHLHQTPHNTNLCPTIHHFWPTPHLIHPGLASRTVLDGVN